MIRVKVYNSHPYHNILYSNIFITHININTHKSQNRLLSVSQVEKNIVTQYLYIYDNAAYAKGNMGYLN